MTFTASFPNLGCGELVSSVAFASRYTFLSKKHSFTDMFTNAGMSPPEYKFQASCSVLELFNAVWSAVEIAPCLTRSLLILL